MGDRGRKSSAELAVIGGTDVIPRPEPPRELNSEQAAEWDAVVSHMPAESFGRQKHGLLSAYCRHVVEQRRIAQLIEKQADDFDLNTYDRLLKCQERESRCIASLAVRLGIADTTAYKHKEAPKGKAPWQIEGQ